MVDRQNRLAGPSPRPEKTAVKLPSRDELSSNCAGYTCFMILAPPGPRSSFAGDGRGRGGQAGPGHTGSRPARDHLLTPNFRDIGPLGESRFGRPDRPDHQPRHRHPRSPELPAKCSGFAGGSPGNGDPPTGYDMPSRCVAVS